jgi:hypothetical protein
MNPAEMIVELRSHAATAKGCEQLTDSQISKLIYHFAFMPAQLRFSGVAAAVKEIEPPKFKAS